MKGVLKKMNISPILTVRELQVTAKTTATQYNAQMAGIALAAAEGVPVVVFHNELKWRILPDKILQCIIDETDEE